MDARRKLNVAFVNGSFLLAAIAGWAFQSWAAFFVGLAVALALNIGTGSIRFSRRSGRR